MKKLIIMAGLPGAGKSYTRQKYYNKYKVVDCDEIKKTLPNYDPMFPRALHEESKVVEKYEIYKNFKDGESFVFDTTGANSDKMIKLTKQAQGLGYEVTIVYVEVSLKTAMLRNSKRSRVVPDEVIMEKYNTLYNSLDKLKLYVDDFITINNEKDI